MALLIGLSKLDKLFLSKFLFTWKPIHIQLRQGRNFQVKLLASLTAKQISIQR